METDKSAPRRVQDIKRLGSQRVLVKFGEISTVSLSYRSLDTEADVLAEEEKSAAWIGYSMFLVTILIVVWGLF